MSKKFKRYSERGADPRGAEKALLITGLMNPGEFGKAKKDLEQKGYDVKIIKWRDPTPVGWEKPSIVIGHSMGGATAINRFGGVEGVQVHNLNGAVISTYSNVINYVNRADPTSWQAFLTAGGQKIMDMITGGEQEDDANIVWFTNASLDPTYVNVAHDKNFTYENYVAGRIPTSVSEYDRMKYRS